MSDIPEARPPDDIAPLLRLGLETAKSADPADETATLITGSPLPHLPPPGEGEVPGDRIGPYRLVEMLGEGGFGIVWRAEQREPILREVALKVIKPGMDSREIITRFEGERQALALMDHPHIAGVLDAGKTESGRLYFAMELVRGVPLTEHCDAHQLTLRQRLELFIPVCQAVQHAHQKGVLHRDLKPSNILVQMVDGKPSPKVIDFGIAKALQTGAAAAEGLSLLQTQGLSLIGTPLYMSPEQAGLSGQDVDSRSDIYSLGVVLYELLTGTTPLSKETVHKAAIDEVLRLIREQDPPSLEKCFLTLGKQTQTVVAQRQTELRKLAAQVRGDIQWIVLRALEKDRERRYASAAALAEDILHHLRDEPVSAGPPSASYRLGKLARRHKAALIAASLVFASLVIGLSLAVTQAIRATRAEQVAESRLGDAQKARDAAEDLVSEGIHGMRDKLVALGKVEVLEDMVKAAQNYYQQLPPELLDHDETQHHLASLALNRATIALALGQYEEHEAQSRECLRSLERLLARQPDNEALHQEACEALLSLGLMFVERNDQDAIFTYTDELGKRAQVWLAKHPGTLWAMRLQVLANTVTAAVLVRELNDSAKAMPVYARAEEVAAQMRQLHGDKAAVLECEGLIHQGRAKAFQSLRQFEAALNGQLEAIRCYEKALQLGGSSTVIEEQLYSSKYRAASMITERARASKDPQERERGRQMAREALEGRARLVKLEPGRAEWWRDLAHSHGNMVGHMDDPVQSLQHRREEIRCREEAISHSPRRPLLYEEKAQSLLALADQLLRQPEPARAEGVQAILDGTATLKQGFELNGGKPVVKGHTRSAVFTLLAQAAEAEPKTGLGWLDEARALLIHLQKVPDTEYGQCLAIVESSRVKVLAALGRQSEAEAEKKQLMGLSGGSTDAPVLHDRALATLRRLRAAADPIPKAPAAERAGLRAPIQAELPDLDKLLNAILAKEPQNAVFRNTCGLRWKLEAELDRWMDRKTEAAANYEKALPLLSLAINFDDFYATTDSMRHFYGEMKDRGKQRAYAQKVLTLLEERYKGKGNLSVNDHFRLGKAWANLADTQLSPAEAATRRESLEKAEAICRKGHEKAGPGDLTAFREWLTRCASLGSHLAQMRDLPASMKWAAPLNQHLAALCEAEPDGRAAQDAIGTKLEAWYGHLSNAVAHEESLTITRLLLALRQALQSKPGYSGEAGRSVAETRAVLARCLFDAGRPSEALAEIASLRPLIAQQTPEIAVEVLRRLAELEDRFPNLKAEALKDARQAYDLAREHQLGSPTLLAAGVYAKYMARQGQAEEALKFSAQVWEEAQATPQKSPPDERLVKFLAAVTEHVLPENHQTRPGIDLKPEAALWLARLPQVATLTGEPGKNAALIHVKELWPQYLGHLWETGLCEECRALASSMLKAAPAAGFPDFTATYAASILALDLGKANWDEAAEAALTAFPKIPKFEISQVAQALALIRTGRAAEVAATFKPTSDKSSVNWLLGEAVLALAHQQTGDRAAAEAVLAQFDTLPPAMQRQLTSPTQRAAISARILLEQTREALTAPASRPPN